MLLKLYPENPERKKLQTVVDCLKKGGVIIYPTDSVYAIGCDITNAKALQRVAQLKGVKLEKANFSIICYDLSNISEYTKSLSNTVFKMLKRSLPGPFTFILPASNVIPKLFKNKKKTIGIRVPDNNIPRDIVNMLGNPIVTTSVKDDDEVIEYTTDPELIYERYSKLVDIVIDGGYGNNEPSTVVDCEDDQPEIIRQGIGKIDL
jgi:tRNA threonylcarbamoyl adenosine modification protein (Sua5/YciO/YrdC/YwlC family)